MMQNDTANSVIAALGRLQQVSTDFDLNPEGPPKPRHLRSAAVLVALQQIDGQMQVILTRRASHLKHHAGQIAFPGGKQDEEDSDIVQTALREADEEIGLPPESVEILGKMPNHETVTSFTVTPVFGLVTGTFTPRPDANEVAEVFTAPLSHLTDISQFSIQTRRWRGLERRYYTVPFGPYYIWGATARIMRGLAEGMRA